MYGTDVVVMEKEKEKMKSFLVGNSFPLSLIRRKVVIEEATMEEFKEVCHEGKLHSFWGHENTRAAAEEVLGVSVKPKEERPAVTLTAEGFPTLDGEVFEVCYVLSPNYRGAFRPKIGEEVSSEQIASWHLLKMIWSEDSERMVV